MPPTAATNTPLSADLGRLARPGSAAPFTAIRLALLDRLIRFEVAGQLDHAAWEEAFAEAAGALREEVVARATEVVEAAGRRSRYPAARLRARVPRGEVAETLLHRLLACAIPLERLAAAAEDPTGRRARGAALEGAWEAAEALASAELNRWRCVAEGIATWRRPLAPLLVGLGTLAVVLGIVAAWLGGQLTAPEWFRPFHAAFWRLPWP